MRALLEQLELTEASRAEIRKAVEKKREAEQRTLDKHNFSPATAANMKGGLDKRMVDLERTLTAYWAASRKAERAIEAMAIGERGSTVEAVRRAVNALELRVKRDGLHEVEGVEADLERLLGLLSKAAEKRGEIEQGRLSHKAGREASPARERTTAERQYDKELKVARGR